MNDKLRIRLVVAVEREAIDGEQPLSPVVAGCVNEELWEHDPDGTDAEIARLRARIDPGGDYYEWREIWATLDADVIADHFRTPTVTAEIE